MHGHRMQGSTVLWRPLHEPQDHGRAELEWCCTMGTCEDDTSPQPSPPHTPCLHSQALKFPPAMLSVVVISLAPLLDITMQLYLPLSAGWTLFSNRDMFPMVNPSLRRVVRPWYFSPGSSPASFVYLCTLSVFQSMIFTHCTSMMSSGSMEVMWQGNVTSWPTTPTMSR